MEPCMNPGETLTCHSPPPVFNVPEPVWRFPSTTTPTEPTTVRWTTSITSAVTTIVTEVTQNLTSTSTDDVTSNVPTGSTTGIYTTEPTEATSPIFPTTNATDRCDPDRDPCCDPEDPCCDPECESGLEIWAIVIIVISLILILIIMILLVIIYYKKYKKRHYAARVPASSLYTTQVSTMGLVGEDESDGKKKTDLAEKDKVCYEYDGKLTLENDYISSRTPENDDINSPKDGVGDEDKPAPVVLMTEL